MAFLLSLFWQDLWRFKVKESIFFCWIKAKTLIKTKWNRKWKILHTVLERSTLRFSLYKNCELKLKLWWVGAHLELKSFPKEFFLTFVFYLNVQCIEWALRMYILLLIKKHHFIHFYCLFLKPSKAFIVSLRNCNDKNEYWKVKRVLRYHVSNRCKFAEKYAHYLVFLIYLFRIKGELLGGPNLSYKAS